MGAYDIGGDKFPKVKIDFSGPIKLSSLYETLWDKIRSLDYTVYESSYRKVVRGPVTDLFISWNCMRKINSYVLFAITVDFEFYNTKEAEIVENGKNVKRTKGFYRIKFQPELILDWAGDWVKSKDDKGRMHHNFRSFLRERYDSVIYGRKPNNPLTHSFGQYKRFVVKLDEHNKLIVNYLRSFYGMVPISGIEEI
ncbi:MAG: hypothetical protein GON13_02810 [Nanoarchaeota archaeon]|nr:hypothetical protein [Nanoarchaeota archaeon]